VGVLSSPGDLESIWNASPTTRIPSLHGATRIPPSFLRSSLAYMVPLTIEIKVVFGTLSLLRVIILLVHGCVLVI
jgi:hypothetical protein